jgi:hypothetical protein
VTIRKIEDNANEPATALALLDLRLHCGAGPPLLMIGE